MKMKITIIIIKDQTERLSDNYGDAKATNLDARPTWKLNSFPSGPGMTLVITSENCSRDPMETRYPIKISNTTKYLCPQHMAIFTWKRKNKPYYRFKSGWLILCNLFTNHILFLRYVTFNYRMNTSFRRYNRLLQVWSCDRILFYHRITLEEGGCTAESLCSFCNLFVYFRLFILRLATCCPSYTLFTLPIRSTRSNPIMWSGVDRTCSVGAVGTVYFGRHHLGFLPKNFWHVKNIRVGIV